MADRSAWVQPQGGAYGDARSVKVLGGQAVPIVVGDLALNKTVGILMVPKGFVLTAMAMVYSDMDTGATLATSIGDMAVPDRIQASATTAQAAATNSTLNASGLYYEFPADTEVIMKTTVAAAGAAAGTVTPYLTGFMR